MKPRVKHSRDDRAILDKAVIEVIRKTRHKDAMKMFKCLKMRNHARFNLLQRPFECSFEACASPAWRQVFIVIEAFGEITVDLWQENQFATHALSACAFAQNCSCERAVAGFRS